MRAVVFANLAFGYPRGFVLFLRFVLFVGRMDGLEIEISVRWSYIAIGSIIWFKMDLFDILQVLRAR